MSTPENEFEPKLGELHPARPSQLRTVRAAIRQASRRLGRRGPRLKQGSIRAHFAKGSAGRARSIAFSMRRVVVKIRYAPNGGRKSSRLRAHVGYLSREAARRIRHKEMSLAEPSAGQARDPTNTIDYLAREDVAGEARLEFFDRANSTVDAKVVTQGWTDDLRHFRMIVSAEDGEALGDLKPFVRELMSDLEAKLGVKLDWLAVNHHDTDNPHTHVLIRGRRPDGQELFIPRRLIASGIREHAQEIVTRALGPRFEVDLRREREREITRRGPTPLDRELVRAVNRRAKLTPDRRPMLTPLMVIRMTPLRGALT